MVFILSGSKDNRLLEGGRGEGLPGVVLKLGPGGREGGMSGLGSLLRSYSLLSRLS